MHACACVCLSARKRILRTCQFRTLKHCAKAKTRTQNQTQTESNAHAFSDALWRRNECSTNSALMSPEQSLRGSTSARSPHKISTHVDGCHQTKSKIVHMNSQTDTKTHETKLHLFELFTSSSASLSCSPRMCRDLLLQCLDLSLGSLPRLSFLQEHLLKFLDLFRVV